MLEGYFDIPAFSFFSQGNIWTGSNYNTFNYRIIPKKAKSDEETSCLKVYVWYGLDCFDIVSDFTAEFEEEFSSEGLKNARTHLTEEFEKYKKIRKNLKFNL